MLNSFLFAKPTSTVYVCVHDIHIWQWLCVLIVMCYRFKSILTYNDFIFVNRIIPVCLTQAIPALSKLGTSINVHAVHSAMEPASS